MPILFNTLLSAAGVNLQDVRLLRHKDTRSARGRTPYELWRDDRPAFNVYQSTQGIANGKRLRASFWAAFVGTPAGETLFVGLYRVKGRKLLDQDTPMPHMNAIDRAGTCHIYDLVLEDNLCDLIGRLVIDWGRAGRAWIQRADRQSKEVMELRRAFKEPDFPGFLSFVSQLSKLNTLAAAWIEVLRASKGVYVLTCPRTKEQYVGSATGAGGFWQRWHDYVQSGHGGNVALKSRDPSDYQVSILEVAGTAATEEEILSKEQQWKRKLQTREMGLTRN